MATRFYFPSEGNDLSSVIPSFDAGWEQTGSVFTMQLQRKNAVKVRWPTGNASAKTVPITTTQDILSVQFVTAPIPPQRITGTFSMVVKGIQSVSTANATLAVVVRVVGSATTDVRGTLFSVFGTDTAFATGTSATRIVNSAAVTALTTQPGDRIVVEIGAHVTAPSTTGTFNISIGDDKASDFALTSALTTLLNPWCEFSQDLFSALQNNYQTVKAEDGISISGGIR